MSVEKILFVWTSRLLQKPAVGKPFLEAFDPFAGGFGVVRPQTKAVAAPGVDVQFGGHFELFEFEIDVCQSFRDVGSWLNLEIRNSGTAVKSRHFLIS